MVWTISSLNSQILFNLKKPFSFSSIHCHGCFNNLYQTVGGEMFSSLHALNNPSELSEINVFLRLQRMPLKEVAKRFETIEFPNSKTPSVAMVSSYYTAFEKRF